MNLPKTITKFNGKEEIVLQVDPEKVNICVYCEKTVPVRRWKLTDELVCYNCRIDLLNTEFAEDNVWSGMDFEDRWNI